MYLVNTYTTRHIYTKLHVLHLYLPEMSQGASMVEEQGLAPGGELAEAAPEEEAAGQLLAPGRHLQLGGHQVLEQDQGHLQQDNGLVSAKFGNLVYF